MLGRYSPVDEEKTVVVPEKTQEQKIREFAAQQGISLTDLLEQIEKIEGTEKAPVKEKREPRIAKWLKSFEEMSPEVLEDLEQEMEGFIQDHFHLLLEIL